MICLPDIAPRNATPTHIMVWFLAGRVYNYPDI